MRCHALQFVQMLLDLQMAGIKGFEGLCGDVGGHRVLQKKLTGFNKVHAPADAGIAHSLRAMMGRIPLAEKGF
jgi:hypothetical protein